MIISPLAAKDLPPPGNTQDKGITVQELLTVSDNHILADDILTVVDSILMVNVLNSERDKDGKALCGQSTKGIHLANPKGHDGVETVHLLELQNAELHRCFLAVVSNASVSLSSCSLVSAV